MSRRLKVNEKTVTSFLEKTVTPYLKHLEKEVSSFSFVFPSDKWFHVKEGKMSNGNLYWAIGLVITENPELSREFFEDFKNWAKQRANAKIYHEKKEG